MALERTLTIIKPDAVQKGVVGRVVAKIEEAGLRILAAKLVHLTPAQAAGFYIVHKDRPFYRSLAEFMTSGPCIPMVLEGEHAIQRLRDLMGATDPSKAAPGTIRREFAASIEANVIHGSDSLQSAGVRDPVLLPGAGDPCALTARRQALRVLSARTPGHRAADDQRAWRPGARRATVSRRLPRSAPRPRGPQGSLGRARAGARRGAARRPRARRSRSACSS